MKQVAFLILLVAISATGAWSQNEEVQVASDAMIEKVEISGISDQRLSSELRDDLHKLEGQKYEVRTAEQFANRIEMELAEYVAAPKTLQGTQPGRVRLMFVVAHISEDEELGSNINARYPVAAVEIEGVSRSLISDTLFDDMQKMVGQRLDHRQAEKLRQRLESELGARYSVVRKIRRSATPRQLKIVYEVLKNPWLPFRDPRSFASYHSKQGFSFAFAADPRIGHQRTQKFIFGAANDGDDLIERFAGFRVGYENIRLATDRVGIRFDYATYHTQWNIHTSNAIQETPAAVGLYRRRRSLDASVAFAIDPHFHITAGVSANELEMQTPTVHFEPARAGTAGLRYRRRFIGGNNRQAFAASYDVRTGARTLDSHFVYTRHFWDARYVLQHDQHVVGATFMAGRTTGSPPLFERFSLGNTETLRGWNKYEFAPLGGSRVAHGSLEYRYDHLQVFYDVGSIWDPAGPIKIKPSIGIGVGSTVKGMWNNNEEEIPFTLGDFSFVFAVPFADGRLQPTVMVVARFRM